MNQERLAMKGQLAQYRQQANRMETEIRGLMLSIRHNLSPHIPDITMLDYESVKISSERLYELGLTVKDLKNRIAAIETDLE